MISAPVRKCELPAHALLEVHQRPGHYVDGYVCQVAGAVALADFVTAFYTSAVFWPVESAPVAPNAAPQRR